MASSLNDGNEPGPSMYETDTSSGINIGKKTMENEKWKTRGGYSETGNCVSTLLGREGVQVVPSRPS